MKQYRNIVICMCILLLLAGGAYAQQKTVRILAIGNSFSQDAVEQYLHELAEAEGISTIIGNMFIGGCSLERHVKNARENAPAYAYRKLGTDGKKREKGKMSLCLLCLFWRSEFCLRSEQSLFRFFICQRL